MAHGPPTVVLTRSTDDNTALADRLTVAGVLVLELPTVCMTQVAPDQSQAELNELVRRAPALAFTSRYGVSAWVARFGAEDLHSARRRGVEIGVVGRATAQALLDAGVTPSLIADPATGLALAAQFLSRLPPPMGAPVLTIGGRHTRPELADDLKAGGQKVTQIVVYENRAPPPPADEDLQRADSAAAIYVAAPSAADRLLAWRPGLGARPFVAIGPTTAAALAQRHGIVAAAVAESPRIAAVEAAILRTIESGSRQ